MLRRLLEIYILVISMLRSSNLKLAQTQGCLQHAFASMSKVRKHNQNKGKPREAMTANSVIQGSLALCYEYSLNLERLKEHDSHPYLKYVFLLVRKGRLRGF